MREVTFDGVADVLLRARINGKLKKKAYNGTDLSPLPAALA
jgi:hypothetical protein